MIMIIRLLTKEELNKSLDFIWRVFCDYEAVNYPEDGKQAFYKVLHSEDYLKILTAYGAFKDDNLIGIIATRNDGSHIALFFVAGEYQRLGIGRKLWETVLENSESEIITVNSSLYAKNIYLKLGFKQKSDTQEKDGIRFIPMEYLHFIDILQDKYDNKAYAETKIIASESEASDKYYRFLPEFAKLLGSKKSYIRIRAIVLCCSQARWDDKGVLAEYLPQMMLLLHDEKASVVRQSLNALKEVVVFRPELCDAILRELGEIDISKYNESMISLIQKDIHELEDLILEKNG